MVKLTKKEVKGLGDNPIRRCSAVCYFFKGGGTGCSYYREKKVKYGDSCLYDIYHLKRYADAFQSGNTEDIKDDASKITAGVVMQIFRMLEQVNHEGATIDEPIMDAKGMPVWIPDPEWSPSTGQDRIMVVAMRKKDHPLIARIIQFSKSIGINLNDFKLTPKSADEKKEVSGRILIEKQEDIKDIMKQRENVEKKFLAAIMKGDEMTKKDPIFQQLIADGSIITDE